MPQIIFMDNASEMIGFADIFNIIDCNAINTAKISDLTIQSNNILGYANVNLHNFLSMRTEQISVAGAAIITKKRTNKSSNRRNKEPRNLQHTVIQNTYFRVSIISK